MIVTNKKRVVRKMNFLVVILGLIFCVTVIGFVLKSLIIYNLRVPLLILIGILIIIIFNSLKNLRIFQFENVGSTFSIKHYHPLKRGIISPYVEFPITNITRFKIEEKFLKSDLLKIDILVKKNSSIIKIKLKISNLKSNDYRKMENSINRPNKYKEPLSIPLSVK
ncbi:hypothetical protein [Chryseobacterium indoltheticum]|uniref:Uncharacterized protein n=1 Tax=Chryseobacterium indoltheticum TaxID=254 RepID=A0A381FQ86_9FLAO|nr:hypothetical protein [Chryseobacterium indoltheticum]SUX48709.1 Uncharacterised protein [Chryseobacterium indoltheticum]